MFLVGFLKWSEFLFQSLCDVFCLIGRILFEMLSASRREKHKKFKPEIVKQRRELLARTVKIGFWFRLALIGAIAIPVFFR